MTELLAPTWRQVAARVAQQIEYGAGHHWLDLDLPAEFPAPVAGQFVQILMPPVSASVFLPRPMSVASVSRTRGALRLGFLYAPVGVGTQALSRLGAGAELEVLGPLGRGFPLDQPGTPVLLAGGRGVAPLLFAAEELARRGRRSVFLFGARTREHLVGLDQARRGIEKIGGQLHLCTDDGSRGFRGNVVQLLESLSADLLAGRSGAARAPDPDRKRTGSNRSPRASAAARTAKSGTRAADSSLVLHACGPHAMLKGVAHWSLARGVPAYLAMESVMACGTGVCRGCPLPRSEAGQAAFRLDSPSLFGNRDFAMCCAEGPVFGAGDLDWWRIE